MYLLLLVFGAVLTAAGLVLAASGVSIHDRAFDATTVTPGIVAAVGGLLLIGLGLALRVLQRIEHALAVQPMPRAARLGEVFEPAAAPELPGEPQRIPFPAKIPHPQPTSTAAPAPSTPPDQRRLEDLPEKFPERFPAVARFESSRTVEETDLALSPSAQSLADAVIGEVNNVRAARRRNVAAPARITPRLDASARSPLTSDRPKGPTFDALWPKGPRSLRAVQSGPARAVATSALEPEQVNEPAFEAPPTGAPDDAATEITILKSGVVDGMAYTLYSDGSIEAELPQGTLRFGSITELRSHIEQGS